MFALTCGWAGKVIRKKLGLKTYRRGGVYYVAESEKQRLESLFERYGLHEGGARTPSAVRSLPPRPGTTSLSWNEVLKSCYFLKNQ